MEQLLQETKREEFFMEKIRIEDLKYEDFIKEDNIYGVVFLYEEERRNLFKKIEDTSNYLRLTLSEIDSDYDDCMVVKVNSVNELQQYVDKLSNNPDGLLYAEGYYRKENFENKGDFEYVKEHYLGSEVGYISEFFILDTSYDFCIPNVNYAIKYANTIYNMFFYRDINELLEDIDWLLNNFNIIDKVWKSTFDEVKENYTNLMIKFQHTFINDSWINMHRECIENDYCFEYKELLNKYDRLLNLIGE